MDSETNIVQQDIQKDTQAPKAELSIFQPSIYDSGSDLFSFKTLFILILIFLLIYGLKAYIKGQLTN